MTKLRVLWQTARNLYEDSPFMQLYLACLSIWLFLVASGSIIAFSCVALHGYDVCFN